MDEQQLLPKKLEGKELKLVEVIWFDAVTRTSGEWEEKNKQLNATTTVGWLYREYDNVYNTPFIVITTWDDEDNKPEDWIVIPECCVGKIWELKTKKILFPAKTTKTVEMED